MDKNLASSRQEAQPYLQQKSELEDDARRIHELYTHFHVAQEEPQLRLQERIELEDHERMVHELPTPSNTHEIGKHGR